MTGARVFLALGLMLAGGGAQAEPYLAAREGHKCMLCHANPTGGGMRSAFGNQYALTRMAAQPVVTPRSDVWTSALDYLLDFGGDLRTAYAWTDIPDQGSTNAFELQEFRLYLAANVIPGQLTIHLDQRLAPGGGDNQEAYVRLWLGEGRYYVKAGRMYLPYGLRLEDDSAFIRAVSGINMTTPDTGVELGLETGDWSVQLAVSNGAAGGPETDEGKQASLRTEYVRRRWRTGASYNYNDAAGGARHMQNLFAGLRTGPVAWLAEADYIVDEGFVTGRRGLWAGLLEANWGYARGHNLKLTGEYFDPDEDVSEDQQARYSLVWEYTPIQFMQLRLGARQYDGIPQNDLQNRTHAFLELHGFF